MVEFLIIMEGVHQGVILKNYLKGKGFRMLDVANGSIIVTDEWTAYQGLSRKFNHVVINHQENEYVRGAFHNNNIEGFWSQMKRGIYGIYHQVSPKHLNKYCDEFSFRYNARKASVNDKFDFSLENSTRLTYKTLIAKS